MAGTQYKPGKMGKITAPLNDKNEIGIDGKAVPVSSAKVSLVQGANPQIGEDCEFKVAYQGPDKGAIIFFTMHREKVPAEEPPIPASKPIDEGLQHNFNEPPEKPSPRTIIGVYVDKSSTQVTVKEGDGINHVYPCDISLLQYLAKKDIPVQKGGTFSWELIQSGEKWIAMKVGPAPAEFTGLRTAKEILQENLNSVKSTTVPPAPATVPKVPVTEETIEAFNERMALKAQEKRAQEKAAAEVKAKADAEADKRMAENAAHAAELAKQAQMTGIVQIVDDAKVRYARKEVPAEPTGIAKIVADTKAKKEETETVVSVPAAQVVPVPVTIVPAGFAVPKNYSSDEMILLRNVIAKDCTEPEFKMMMYMAGQYGLDPLIKQIWAIKRNERSPAVIMVGRDGMLAIAHRSGQFDGMRSWVEYAEGDTERKKPLIGHCEVFRKDMSHSFKTEVLFSEYVQPVPASGYLGLWQTKPSVMIIKVAESVCLRKAFVVSGVYDPDEIHTEG